MAEYNQLTPEFIAELENIVGGDNCLTGEDINEDYSHDEMPIYGTHMPDAVVLPANTDEVSAIMKLASANNIPVTVRGAGTGLVGGSTPLAGGIALCTMRMDKILEYDENNLFVRVQPGVRLCDLAADAIDHGFMYPPDPGEKTGSIGGNVSTNAGGMRAVKYGTTRDYVLAMTVVLPSGEVLRLGREVAKTSSGYSLLHLMVGSEGTLGIITELSMKLIPNPKEDMSFILSFSDIQTAIAAVPKIKLAGLNPQESGNVFECDLGSYLDTGIFLDHRVTREMVGSMAEGKSFLNLFSYTGTCTVHAAVGGAKSTLTVDLSQTYLSWAHRNMELNGCDGPEHGFVRADVLQWIEREARGWRRFDLIFVDPPTFSNSKAMGKNTWSVQRDHVKLLTNVVRLLERDGVAVFSCNLRNFKPDVEALAEAGVAIEDITPQTIPHDFERNVKIHCCYLVRKA